MRVSCLALITTLAYFEKSHKHNLSHTNHRNYYKNSPYHGKRNITYYDYSNNVYHTHILTALIDNFLISTETQLIELIEKILTQIEEHS